MTFILIKFDAWAVTLADLEVGPIARVTSVHADDPVMLRLMEMGLVPGTPVQVMKRAPFGGPMQIRVRDYRLSIRRSEASRLEVRIAEST